MRLTAEPGPRSGDETRERKWGRDRRRGGDPETSCESPRSDVIFFVAWFFDCGNGWNGEAPAAIGLVFSFRLKGILLKRAGSSIISPRYPRTSGLSADHPKFGCLSSWLLPYWIDFSIAVGKFGYQISAVSTCLNRVAIYRYPTHSLPWPAWPWVTAETCPILSFEPLELCWHGHAMLCHSCPQNHPSILWSIYPTIQSFCSACSAFPLGSFPLQSPKISPFFTRRSAKTMASKSSAFDEDWRYRNWLGWRCDDGNGDGGCDKTI